MLTDSVMRLSSKRSSVMSKNSMFSLQTRALWQKRFLEARFAELDLDFWNTIAFSPAKVHPRMLEKLGVQSSPLSQVCREPVVLAQAIINHRAPSNSTSGLDDLFLEHCMVTNPFERCQCDSDLNQIREQYLVGAISQADYFAAVTRDFLKETAGKFVDHQPTDEDHADLEEVIRREQKWLHVFDDASKLLEASLGRRRMNIISNMMWYGEQHFDRKEVNGRKLRDYFHYIITSPMLHFRKPDLGFFTGCPGITGQPLEKRLIVEDSLANVLASLNAGYKYAVLVNRDDELTDAQINSLPDNVLVVDDLMQLDAVLPEYIGV
jgi:FMN phosphatase YigB (HAD superfamily)